MPLLFACYLAAVPAYGARPSLLFGFLFLIDGGLLAIAIARRQGLLHAIGAAATLLVMATWMAIWYRVACGRSDSSPSASRRSFRSSISSRQSSPAGWRGPYGDAAAQAHYRGPAPPGRVPGARGD